MTAPVRLTPEEGLLLECARLALPRPAPGRPASLRPDLDWDWVVESARRHGLLLLLARRLRAAGAERLPARLLQRLEPECRRGLQQVLLLADELVDLARHLQRQGVRLLAFKGPALAAAVYPGVGLRQFSDIDLLVPRQQLARARDLLLARGYRPWFAPGSPGERALVAMGTQLPLASGDGLCPVELHWDLGPRYWPYPLAVGALWERAQTIDIGGQPVPTLHPEDRLRLLLLHGTHHCWMRLTWVVDVGAALACGPTVDAARLLAWARRTGLRRAVLVGLRLARTCTGVQLPVEVEAELASEPQVHGLADRLLVRLLRDPRSTKGRFHRSTFQPFHLAVLERGRDRLAYLLRVALLPSIEDWLEMPLPAPWFSLYHLLRPLRLGRKVALDLMRSGGRRPSLSGMGVHGQRGEGGRRREIR